MKVIRLARNVLLGRALVGLLALRRRAAARERRVRLFGAALFAACGAGAGWAARRALRARSSRNPADARGGSDLAGESGLAATPAAAAQPAAPARAPTRTGVRAAKAAQPGVKKQRKRARRAEAEERAKADRSTAHGGPVKLEINETPGLRAPLGDLIKN